jgi:murein DD-endopeptidase MepM/ murein hydrolase activator NlpD
MQENNEKKPSAKKLITYYLILAGCLLIAAAVTVTLILTLGKTDSNIEINNPSDDTIIETPDDTQTPSDNITEPTEPDTPTDTDPTEPDTPQHTTSSSGYILPVDNVELLTAYTFFHNTTINTYQLHQGLDFSAAEGTPVYAVLDGTVQSVFRDDVLEGTIITISHANGITSIYEFIDADENLKAGDIVKQGDVIGTVAAANGKERKMGAHLHFELRSDNKAIDPEQYLEIETK